MRATFPVIALALVGCGQPAEAPPAAETPAVAAAANTVQAGAEVLARIGGVVIQAGQHFVEVLPFSTGHVQASVYAQDGTEVTGDGTLTVQVKGADGQMHPVALAWDAEEQLWQGDLEGADETTATVVTGPVSVTFAKSGQTETGRVEAVTVVEPPQYGGTVVLAGDVAAEVKTEADGQIAAVVYDSAGQPVAGGEGVEVVANVQVAGQERPVTLTWSPEEARYVGAVEAQLVPGPVSIVVTRNGRRHQGRAARVVVVRPAAIGGQVVVANDYAVEVKPGDADGYVEAVVFDPQGNRVQGRAGVDVTVRVGGRPVVMVWDAAAGRYKGRAEGVDVRTAPVGVVVVANGRRHRGHMRRGLAVGHRLGHPAVVVRADGTTVVRGADGAQVVQGAGGTVVVRGQGGRAVVTGPNGNVAVRGPGGGVVVTNMAGGAVVRGPGGGVVVRAPTGGVVVRPQGGGAVSVMTNVPTGVSVMAGASAMEQRRHGGVSAMGGVSVMLGR